MTAPDAASIRARLDAATPGPWKWTNEPRQWLMAADGSQPVLACATLLHPEGPNAELIAHAPTDLAALLGAVEAVLALVPHFNVTIDHGNGVTENLGATLEATIHQHLGGRGA